MKKLLLFIMLFTSLSAQASAICQFLDEPCDNQGNTYYCFYVGRATDYRPPTCSAGPSRKKSSSALDSIINRGRQDAYDDMDRETPSDPHDFMRECVRQCQAQTGGSADWCNGSYCW